MTLIPTMQLRWQARAFPLPHMPDVAEMRPVLQQMFNDVRGGSVWNDVPTVEEAPDAR